MLWVDDHRPLEIEDLGDARLLRYSGLQPMNTVFCGPDGSGKTTRAMALVRKWIGSDTYDSGTLETVEIAWEKPGMGEGSKKRARAARFGDDTQESISVLMTVGDGFTEMRPRDAGNKDYRVIQELVATQVVKVRRGMHIIIIHAAGEMSARAKQALHSQVEKADRWVKFVLVVNTMGQLTKPLQSRFVAIRVPSPSRDALKGIVGRSVELAGKPAIPEPLMDRILDMAKGNIRNALLRAQAVTSIGGMPISPSRSIPITDVERAIDAVSVRMERASRMDDDEAYVAAFGEIRNMLGEMLDKEVPPKQLICLLLNSLMDNLDIPEEYHPSIVGLAARYEVRMGIPFNAILHVDAFVSETIDCLRVELPAKEVPETASKTAPQTAPSMIHLLEGFDWDLDEDPAYPFPPLT